MKKALNTKIVLKNKLNLNRPEISFSGQLAKLQGCLRLFGVAQTVNVSAKLAVRCRWMESPTAGVDPSDLAFVTALVLKGWAPCRRRQTARGLVLLMESPFLIGATEMDLPLGILLGGHETIDLINPDELDQNFPKRASILVAEDDPEVAAVLCAMLERSGFTVVHAPDGRAAWRLLQSQCLDAVVLDVDMPGYSGVEVCERIRSAPLISHLPVILCSGQTDLATLARQAGADDFVEKPPGILKLPELITRLLGLSGTRPQPAGDQ